MQVDSNPGAAVEFRSLSELEQERRVKEITAAWGELTSDQAFELVRHLSDMIKFEPVPPPGVSRERLESVRKAARHFVEASSDLDDDTMIWLCAALDAPSSMASAERYVRRIVAAVDDMGEAADLSSGMLDTSKSTRPNHRLNTTVRRIANTYREITGLEPTRGRNPKFDDAEDASPADRATGNFFPVLIRLIQLADPTEGEGAIERAMKRYKDRGPFPIPRGVD